MRGSLFQKAVYGIPVTEFHFFLIIVKIIFLCHLHLCHWM